MMTFHICMQVTQVEGIHNNKLTGLKR